MSQGSKTTAVPLPPLQHRMATRLATTVSLRHPLRFAGRRLAGCLAPRSRFSTSQGDGTPDLSPEAVERVQAISTSISGNVAQGVSEMRAAFGEHAVPLWMNDYYKHRADAHRFIVPAISLICSDAQSARLPSVSAKNAVFLATALSALPRDTAMQYLTTSAMAAGTDIAFILAVASLMRNESGADLFRRLASSAKRSGNRPLNEIAQRLAAVPSTPVVEWADPLDDPAALHRHWEGGGGMGAPPQAFEVTAWFGPARDVLGFHDFLLLGATTVLEAQWALFYATGSQAPLRRVLEMGRHWAQEGAHLPNAIDLLVNLQSPLPPELLNKSADPATAAGSVKLQVGRIALWSLLRQARRHRAIPDAVVTACAELTGHLVEPDAREDGGAAEGSAARPPLAPWPQAQARVEVFPALLHLMARSRLDAPFPEDAAAGGGGGGGASA